MRRSTRIVAAILTAGAFAAVGCGTTSENAGGGGGGQAGAKACKKRPLFFLWSFLHGATPYDPGGR